MTGLPMAANDPAAQRPALLVKVDNAFEARPQTGIEKADIVYEELVEGGITRFAAIFQSTDPGEVGPVRSVRPVDPALAAPLHGLAVFSGGIPAFVSQLDAVAQNLSAEQIGERPPYRRSRDRTAPHNLYVGAGGLWKLAQPPYNTPPAPVFAYGSLPSSGPKPAASAKMSFDSHNTIAWRWDGSVWRRSQNGRPFDGDGQRQHRAGQRPRPGGSGAAHPVRGCGRQPRDGVGGHGHRFGGAAAQRHRDRRHVVEA